MTTSEEFAEMLAQAHELRLLRAVADAARALIRNDGEAGAEVSAESLGRSLALYSDRRAALAAALSALDGDDQ